MRSEEFEALLKAELDEAKMHYERAKAAYAAYTASQNPENKMRRLAPYPDRKASSVHVAVRMCISQLNAGDEFAAKDIFEQMDEAGLIDAKITYEQARSSISYTLARLVEEGSLQKKSWRIFMVADK